MRIQEEFKFTSNEMVRIGDKISQATKKPATNYENTAKDLYIAKGGQNAYPNTLRLKVEKIQKERMESDKKNEPNNRNNSRISPNIYLEFPV